MVFSRDAQNETRVWFSSQPPQATVTVQEHTGRRTLTLIKVAGGLGNAVSGVGSPHKEPFTKWTLRSDPKILLTVIRYYLILSLLFYSCLAFSAGDNSFIRIKTKQGRFLFSSSAFGEFFSVGSNSFMESASNKQMKAVFKSREIRRTYEDQLKEYRSFEFNSLGGWSNVSFLKGQLPYTIVLFDDDHFPRSNPLQDCKGNSLPSGDADPLPNPVNDPFSSEYVKSLRKYIRDFVWPHKNDRALMLYWLGHEFGVGGSDAIDLSPYTYSKDIQNEFRRWLKSKYKSFNLLSRSWNSHDTSFEEITKRCPSSMNQEVEDRREFSSHVLREWFKLVVSEIRKVDPNHLISSPKVSIWDFKPNLDFPKKLNHFSAMAGLFDLISVDWYTSNTEHSDESFRQLYEISQTLKLPVLVAEFGTRQKMEGWSNTPGARILLGTQVERGERYQSQLGRLFKEKWIIGAHWFRWQDHFTDSDQMNKGIVRVEADRILPYEDLKSAMIKAHRAIARDLTR